MIKFKGIILMAWIGAIILGCQNEQNKADKLFFGGVVYSVDAHFSVYEAMAIHKDRIVGVGTAEALRKQFRFGQEIDLEGRPVFPGFIDAHCHLVGYAHTLSQVNLMGCRSEAEAVERCRVFYEKHKPPFILGRGWDQNLWDRKVFPSAASLDEVFPEIPVILKRVDGHAAWLNTAALATGNLDCQKEIVGGKVLCIDDKPSGVLIDNAMDLIPPLKGSHAQFIQSLIEAQNHLLSVGLTTVDDAGLVLRDIQLIDSLQRAGVLHLRVYAMAADQEENWAYFNQHGMLKTSHMNVRSFKVYGDGALGSRGASLLAPYSDAPNESGFLLADSAYFADAARKCREMGFQMNTHAIGDRANRTMLQIYQQQTQGIADHRWRIEHAQVVDPKDFELFNRAQIIPSVQPTHATSDMYWASSRLGPERLPFAYAFNSLYQQAGILALGTDFPVEEVSPFKTFFAAVVRKDSLGFPENGFFPNESLSRELALRGMTIMAAYANFEESEKGSLEVGKFADFIILDRDIMQVNESELLNTNTLQTWIGGKLLFIKNR